LPNEDIRLSLAIYLDDCAYDKILADLLRQAGHHVVTPADAGTSGAADDVHFRLARANGWVLLTKNPLDFEQLHQADSAHAGILAIYQDNDPARDMDRGEIVRAVANLEQASVVLPGQFHVLNHWRY
jgi:hypothetical protein